MFYFTLLFFKNATLNYLFTLHFIQYYFFINFYLFINSPKSYLPSPQTKTTISLNTVFLSKPIKPKTHTNTHTHTHTLSLSLSRVVHTEITLSHQHCLPHLDKLTQNPSTTSSAMNQTTRSFLIWLATIVDDFKPPPPSSHQW